MAMVPYMARTVPWALRAAHYAGVGARNLIKYGAPAYSGYQLARQNAYPRRLSSLRKSKSPTSYSSSKTSSKSRKVYQKTPGTYSGKINPIRYKKKTRKTRKKFKKCVFEYKSENRGSVSDPDAVYLGQSTALNKVVIGIYHAIYFELMRQVGIHVKSWNDSFRLSSGVTDAYRVAIYWRPNYNSNTNNTNADTFDQEVSHHSNVYKIFNLFATAVTSSQRAPIIHRLILQRKDRYATSSTEYVQCAEIDPLKFQV